MALDRRLMLLAARQYLKRKGRESAGPRFKKIFRKDEAAVMAFLLSTAPMSERMRAFMRARRVAGADTDEVASDVESRDCISLVMQSPPHPSLALPPQSILSAAQVCFPTMPSA